MQVKQNNSSINAITKTYKSALKANCTFSDEKIYHLACMDNYFKPTELEKLKKLKRLATVIWSDALKENELEEKIDEILLGLRINFCETAYLKAKHKVLEKEIKNGRLYTQAMINDFAAEVINTTNNKKNLEEQYHQYWIEPLKDRAIAKRVELFKSPKASQGSINNLKKIVDEMTYISIK